MIGIWACLVDNNTTLAQTSCNLHEVFVEDKQKFLDDIEGTSKNLKLEILIKKMVLMECQRNKMLEEIIKEMKALGKEKRRVVHRTSLYLT